MSRLALIYAAVALVLTAVGCGTLPPRLDAMSAVQGEDIGRPVLEVRWRMRMAERYSESNAQEFAVPAMSDRFRQGGRIYVGSKGGTFYALDSRRGRVLWKKEIGSVSSQPLVYRGKVYVGTEDGIFHCMEEVDGRERWKYPTRGPIQQPPVVVGDMVLFANEADQVYALDRETGKFRWQYKTETPEEFTLRGHAGLAVDDELVFTGFADGTLVAIRVASGTVAWIKSLKGDRSQFVDVDATPIVHGDVVYASSSAGGIYGLDKETGLTRWRIPVLGAGPLTTDGERIYAAAAEQGVYAIDFAGHVVWRQGTRGGGEPAKPVVTGEYLMYSLSDAGLFVANRENGRVYQFFDPGNGVSATPMIIGDDLFVVSNGSVLYAMQVARFE